CRYACSCRTSRRPPTAPLFPYTTLFRSGDHAEPVAPSGVPEIAALESALERMRRALTGTTISRDYLDAVLNSMNDAVLVTAPDRSEEHTSELQSRENLVCRLLLEKKNKK